MSPTARYALAAGTGTAAWLSAFVGGVAAADGILRTFGVVAVAVWLFVLVVVLVAAPVYVFTRGTDDPDR